MRDRSGFRRWAPGFRALGTGCLLLDLLAAGCGRQVPSTGSTAGSAPPAAAPSGGGGAAVDPAYREELETWRAERVARLNSEQGWLSVVGLWWLESGANPVGSVPDGRVVLPASVPPRIGSVEVADSSASFEAAPEAGGVAVVGGEGEGGDRPLAAGDRVDLATDVAAGGPTILAVGRVRFFVIDRHGRLGVRVKDPDAPARRDFAGLEYFPIDPTWRVEARFEPSDPPKKIPVPNILGTISDKDSPGAVVFDHGGATYRLDALIEPGESDLFLILGDRTNGHGTYGGGRFLYAPGPGPDGRVVVDFNRAYNPPCAFTEFATCPLPPPGNKLPIAIEAGEKRYAHSAH